MKRFFPEITPFVLNLARFRWIYGRFCEKKAGEDGRVAFKLDQLWEQAEKLTGFIPTNKDELVAMLVSEYDARLECINNVGARNVKVSAIAHKIIDIKGGCSTFGGPDDRGMAMNENLSLYWTHDQCDARPDLFLPRTPENEILGTSKRLDTTAHYIAIRFDKPSRTVGEWRTTPFLVLNYATGAQTSAFLVDWGPHKDTGRVADLSEAVEKILGLKTDAMCRVLEMPYGLLD